MAKVTTRYYEKDYSIKKEREQMEKTLAEIALDTTSIKTLSNCFHYLQKIGREVIIGESFVINSTLAINTLLDLYRVQSKLLESESRQ